MGEAVVHVLAALAAFLGLFVVFARSPFTCAFALVGLMVCLGGIYGLIGAHFVAALQVIVYAGAIMVLFVFAIMLMNLNEDEKEYSWGHWRTYAAIFLSVAVLLVLGSGFAGWLSDSRQPASGPWTFAHVKEAGGNVVALSGELFSQAYVQFEIISLLLLVAIVAALILAKRKVD